MCQKVVTSIGGTTSGIISHITKYHKDTVEGKRLISMIENKKQIYELQNKPKTAEQVNFLKEMVIDFEGNLKFMFCEAVETGRFIITEHIENHRFTV